MCESQRVIWALKVNLSTCSCQKPLKMRFTTSKCKTIYWPLKRVSWDDGSEAGGKGLCWINGTVLDCASWGVYKRVNTVHLESRSQLDLNSLAFSLSRSFFIIFLSNQRIPPISYNAFHSLFFFFKYFGLLINPQKNLFPFSLPQKAWAFSSGRPGPEARTQLCFSFNVTFRMLKLLLKQLLCA